MKRECLYTDKISGLKLNNDAKDRILQNLCDIENEKEEKRSSVKARPLAKRASFWIPLTSALCVAVLAIGILVGVFAPTNIPVGKEFIVQNPLEAQDRLYLTGVAQNAQYLPDVKQLSSTSSDSYQIAMASDSEVQDLPVNADKRNLYFQVDASNLYLTENTYQEINERLATNSSTRENDLWTIDNIRKEVMFMMEVIPGYGQWFYLSGEMSYVQNYDDYQYSTYKLDYDKDNDVISMTRVSNGFGINLYDTDTQKFYCYLYYEPTVYLRDVLNVKYYKNDEGKEVVECTNTRYFVFGGKTYLYSTEVLKNTANESAVKLSVYNIFARDFNQPVKVTEENGRTERDTYVLQDYNPYGKVVKYMQVDYSDENVALLNIDQVLSSELEDYSATYLAYYERNGNDAMFYNANWDYYDDEASEAYKSLENVAYTYTDDYEDGYRIFGPPDVNSSDLYYNRYPYHMAGWICSYCNDYDTNYTDAVVYCPHIKTSEQVTRKYQSLTVSKDGKFTAEDSEKTGLASMLEKYEKSLNGQERIFGEWSDGEYAFEKQVDEYLADTVKYYIDSVLQIDEVDSVANDSYNHEVIDDEQMAKIMESTVLGISEIESNNTITPDGDRGVVNYDITVTLNDVETDPDKQYYFAIYTDTNSEIKINGVTIAQVAVDMSGERVFSIKGQFDSLEIAQLIQFDIHADRSSRYKICVGIVSYDDDGNLVRETTAKMLQAESERSFYSEFFNSNGYLLWYRFGVSDNGIDCYVAYRLS